MEDIILKAAIAAATIVISYVATQAAKMIKSKLTAQQLELANVIVKFAVKAAEQLFEKSQGAEKFEYAKSLILNELHSKGLVMSEELVKNLIEAAVLELHKKLEELNRE